MSRRIIVDNAALADLKMEARYIAADNKPASKRLTRNADATFADLAQRPAMGAEYELGKLGKIRIWRITGFEKYLIFYREIPDAIEIIRVLHGARDWESLLAEDPQ